jgi:hypothetical protein
MNPIVKLVLGLAIFGSAGCTAEVDSAAPLPSESEASGEALGTVAQPLVAGPNDIGVIANGACPNPVTIYMDDEDSSNNSSLTDWVGSINSQTRLEFCRVDGSAFRGTGWCNRGDYAVLKLGTSCPNGSREVSRYFDNEDSSNNNSNSGNIAPSTQSSSGTTLRFCAFAHYELARCTANSPIIEFPDVGFSYGVFADTTVYGALQTGQVYTDDEDSSNGNRWDLSQLDSWQVPEVQSFLFGGSNTVLKTVRVR